MRALALLVVAIIPTTGFAQKAYRCESATGVVVFSQTPCGKNAKELDATPRLKQQPATDAVSAISDSVRLSQIDINCGQRRAAIMSGFGGEIAQIDQSVRSLRTSKQYSNNNLAGATRDQGIETQIQTLEIRRSTILQTRAQLVLDHDRQCAEQRAAEVKRQSGQQTASN